MSSPWEQVSTPMRKGIKAIIHNDLHVSLKGLLMG